MGSNGNGKPALSFQQKSAIPIIGQPFTIKGWFPTVLIGCNCGQHEAVMVPRGGAAACPSCHRVFTIQAVQFTPDGNVNFGIGVMMPDDSADVGKGQVLGHQD